jgi:RHS repeat-associated protein
VEQIDASGKVVYYHQDQLGSTRALTDQAGTTVATSTYDAYGKTTASTGSVTTPFGFAGEYTDAESGLQYLRARYYDPATAQFLTRDPLVAQSGQPYAYANNSPLNFTDPSGQIAWLAVVPLVWGAIELGGAVIDGVSTAKTLTDPCASGWDKAVSGGLFAFGAAAPGFGYSTGGRAAAEGGSKLVQGARYPLAPKIQRQLGNRGWTTEAIDEAVQSGQHVRAVNKATGNPATRHVHPTTGKSVVIDDVTGQVIHVGGPGFKYGPGSGDLP